MVIVVVDNYCDRLSEFAGLLHEAYPSDTVVEFFDPFRAGQYICNNEVDIAFVDIELRPFDAFKFAELAAKLRDGIKTIVLTDDAEESFYIMEEGYNNVSDSLARPVSIEKLRQMAG